MVQPLVDELSRLLSRGRTTSPPRFAGAVCGIDDGRQVSLVSQGWAYRYADAAGTRLPDEDARPVTDHTVFDLASITKLFTAMVIAHLAEQGALELDHRLGRFFDEYAMDDRRRVTVRMLLTHTSGLPADIFLARDHSGVEARRAALLARPLEAAPGTRSCYSCVGYLTLGLLAERLLGQPLSVAVHDLICAPLGMRRTGFRPLEWAEPDDLAATEMRPTAAGRRPKARHVDPRGVVHDENAAALGGVAGNAGLFADAADLLAFGRAHLNGLAGSSALSLSPTTLRELVTPQLPAALETGYRSGLGFRIDDSASMGGLVGSQQAYGHPGFTGTSMVLDERRDVVLVLLTNRVHPSRTWSELASFRRQVADTLAAHYPV